MSNFYSPHKFDPDHPITMYCIPVKVMIGVIQGMFTLCWLMAAFTGAEYVVVPAAIMAGVNAIFFFSFLGDVLIVMIIHFVVQSIFIVVPVLFAIGATLMAVATTSAFFLVDKIFPQETAKRYEEMLEVQNPFLVLIMAILFLAAYLYYMNLVYVSMRYVELKRHVLRSEPDFETTQGLFQRDETAYDGGHDHRHASIYPKL